jgi:protein SCO1/2
MASLPAYARRLALAAAIALGSLAGLAPAAHAGAIYDVSGHLPDLRFSLSGAHGKTVTNADLAGKTVLLFFGYASCPDICPTTMAQLSEVLRSLDEWAEKVRIVFISVDPHRDTPDTLQAYVDAFDRRAIGLTGNESQISDLARRYRVAYQIQKPQAGAKSDDYEVTHSRGVYIFDKTGRARLLASDSANTEALTRSVRDLLGLKPR